MRISKDEQQAIKTVVSLGEKFGYGNLICHLQTAWAAQLVKEYGFTEEVAMRGESGYPIKMHEDLMNNGEWDETGKRYI